MIKKTNAIIFAFLAFVIGGILFSGRTETIEVERNLAEWQELKEIDDQGFQLAGQVAQICGEGYKAFGEEDWIKFDEIVERTGDIGIQTTELAERRQEVLQKLGY